MTIFCDMDNTLLATFESARKFAQKSIYGGDFHKNMNITLNKPLDKDVTTYSTTGYLEACGMSHNEAILMRYLLFHSTEYWRTLEFEEGAKDIFHCLYDKHDVYIVTSAFLSHADECILGKLRFIEEQMPWFDMKKLIYSHSKWKLNGDVFIEDVWEQMSEFNGKKILFDRPYNRNATPDIRVTNWDQIGDYIQNL